MTVPTNAIPSTLRELDQWLIWRYETNSKGKPTKVPYQAAHPARKASSMDPSQWSDYATAVRETNADGIGFVFTAATGMTGIDLDACIDPDTGEMEKWARRIVEQMDTYTEISPSGWGVKMWVYATAPANTKRNVQPKLPPWPHGKERAIEMYDRGRYFTVTGEQWPGTPNTINERQDVLDALYAHYWPEEKESDQPPAPRNPNTLEDAELLRIAFRSRNGDAIRRLYELGDIANYAGDESSADLALCNHLAFYTGNDPQRMDRLFRSSALMRPKWDEKRGPSTWGEITIGVAIASTSQTYSPGVMVNGSAQQPQADPVVVSTLTGRVLIGQAMRDGIPDTEWLVEPVLVRGRIHMLYGEPESGKTIIALSWILHCISLGLDVLYIDEETGLHSVAKLLIDMGADPDLVDKHVHYFPFPGIDREAYAALLMYADFLEPAYCLFDSLTDMLSVAGLDENSGIEVTGWMLDVAQALARRGYQPAVTLVDHVTKDTANIKYSVASRAKKAKSDVLWYVEKQADFDPTKTAPVDLHRHKNRPGVLPKFVRYIVGGQDGKLVCHPFDATQDVISALSAGAEEMLETLRENGAPMSPGHLSKLFGKHRDTIRKWGQELISKGLVKKDGSTRDALYELDESSNQFDESSNPNLTSDLTILGLSIEPNRQNANWASKRRMPYKEDEDWE